MQKKRRYWQECDFRYTLWYSLKLKMDGRLYHRIYLVTEWERDWGPRREKREFLLDDATGEISEK